MADENHYEVLGVRPEAPLWEIELAYKGRRSQYHPDRYAAGDEAAVAWATAKMQAVNKACAALNDPEPRERIDRAQASAGSCTSSGGPKSNCKCAIDKLQDDYSEQSSWLSISRSAHLRISLISSPMQLDFSVLQEPRTGLL
ncbi:DnaJ domain-containing protein [Stenotrophomonas sp.]|uniref:J domain-containing protein n=1 Tax=Stenotrophomonas sp. TaxID=69392 RepID=UPI0028AD9ABA|nr:DnaJ domain-containing protein [Stenotrophomonas sp.]